MNDYYVLLKKSFAALLICAILVAISYYFVDKPVAYFIYNHQVNQHLWLRWFTQWPIALMVAGPILTLIILISLAWSPFSYWKKVIVAATLNLAFSIQIKNGLKYIFGSTWPLTWTHHNQSLITNHVYGFHFFHGGIGYAAFPSGTMVIVLSVAGVFWLAYRHWLCRLICAFLAVVTAIAMLGMDYHFVSDLIAGTFIGAITSAWAAKLTLFHSNYCRDQISKPEE